MRTCMFNYNMKKCDKKELIIGLRDGLHQKIKADPNTRKVKMSEGYDDD